jgi:small subunit ribosomal protein S16
MGKKKQPTYRLVAADSRSPRDGRFLEVLGTYEPRGASRANPETVLKVDNDKAVAWLRNGAQPTERVEKLLKASGAWDVFRGDVAPTAAAAADAAPSAAEAPVSAAGVEAPVADAASSDDAASVDESAPGDEAASA